MAGCPCCIEPWELEILVRTPLRELTAEQLETYAFSAVLTVGDASDLRYFWPRLAQLAAQDELKCDLEVVFSKPRHGAWHDWPSVEREALLAFSRAQILALAASGADPDDYKLDAWVCALGQFTDVTRLLNPLLLDEPERAAALLQLYSTNEDELARDALWNAFWQGVPENAARLRAWFASEAVVAALVRALDRKRPAK